VTQFKVNADYDEKRHCDYDSDREGDKKEAARQGGLLKILEVRGCTERGPCHYAN